MPELRCTVQTCLHNKDFYCDLDGIRVGGSQAKNAGETCCDSFEERKGDSYSNVTGSASPTSSIDCKATDCKSAAATPERSAWREARHVSVSRPNVQHLPAGAKTEFFFRIRMGNVKGTPEKGFLFG